MSVVVKVENVSKEYRLGTIGHGTLTHDLQSFWAKIRGKEDPNQQIGTNRIEDDGRFWALRDVSFEVKQGEVLGIIGKNGAGKSTLLKILSRVTTPSKGFVRTKGRVASLLEVGTGFHPELTGRENIYLNGAILGMTRPEVKKKLDSIVDFSGIEDFIDTPVKRYSSGMYVRLAFAVAAHLESEILIIDEVLAVGDAEFQKKCLGKMSEVSQGEGRTVLFVSHNMAAIRNLCERVILLKDGKVADEGKTDSVIESYLQKNLPIEKVSSRTFEVDERKRYQLISARMLTESQKDQFVYSCDSPIFIELMIRVLKKQSGDCGYLVIQDRNDTTILASDSNDVNLHSFDKLEVGMNRLLIKIPERLLAGGAYSVYLNFTDSQGNSIDSPGKVCFFEVSDVATYRGNRRVGFLSTLLSWDLQKESVTTDVLD